MFCPIFIIFAADTNSYTHFMNFKSFNIVLVLLLAAVQGVWAQQTETFSVVTLNVDGLPQKIWFANVNADGPGSAGSVRIGQYLQKKDYDLVFVQEDFNYHEELTILLEEDYRFDTWSGDVGVDGHSIDLLHLQNHRFECDGLGAFLKNNIVMADVQRTPWTGAFGKFSHAFDEMVTKGFRRYLVTLPGGTELIVYNMHMDAGDEADEKEGNDGADREARQSEWQQLKDDVLAHLDTRPVIVVGDLNSYYCRDQIKAKFIDAIAESGKGVAKDVWVELEKKGEYPAPKDGIICCETDGNILDGEVLDKIIYINPTSGTNIKPLSYSLDQEGYKRDGKMLGDHFPLAATFMVDDGKSTGIHALDDENDAVKVVYYNLNGQRIDYPAKGIYVESKGKDTRKRIIK